jgi:outer membrane murein-binding lipoprotein Lpp
MPTRILLLIALALAAILVAGCSSRPKGPTEFELTATVDGYVEQIDSLHSEFWWACESDAPSQHASTMQERTFGRMPRCKSVVAKLEALTPPPELRNDHRNLINSVSHFALMVEQTEGDRIDATTATKRKFPFFDNELILCRHLVMDDLWNLVVETPDAVWDFAKVCEAEESAGFNTSQLFIDIVLSN